ncbi:MAG: helix-turn-helix domain-containing protein [Planctomycetia bacterium]
MPATVTTTGASLDERRRELRMTIPQLARRSGISTATVARVLRGEPTVAIGHVSAVADALGMQVGLRARVSVDSLLRQAAHSKAKRVAALVQATSALEGQGLSRQQFDAMVDRTTRELQAAGGKTLWAD